MIFRYEIIDNKGKVKKGKLKANDKPEARNRLLLQEGTLVSLESIKGGKGKSKKGGGIVFGKVKLVEKVMLAKHLSVMIKSGMSIDIALKVLADNASSLMAKRLRSILADVKKGNNLASGFKKFPKDFDHLFINMIAAGEKGGNLSKNLELLSVQHRKTYELKGKMKAAGMYPMLVLLAIVALLAVVSIFVLPKIINFFSTLKVELPLSTRLLMSSSTFLVNYWPWLLGAVILLVIVIRLMAKFAVTRIKLHYLILKIPLIGDIVKNINLALFCRTLGSLLDSGITIDQALQIVAQTVTSDVYKKEILQIYHRILKGSSLAESMKNKNYFPSIVSSMSNVGEESGNLSEVLDYLADFYESEVDHTTKNLATMLEPALLIFIGLIVGFVAISIINPIYDLTSRVGR
ncbi:type II secretion system F family protein [bacterium]|nr:type II secretion system F family protein [bacterium]